MINVLFDVLKLIIAILVGSIIGRERKKSGKPVGMRTLSLVCSGSAFITILAMNHFPTEAGKILAGVMTGVGFLGAGAIIADGNRVKGLTTAASVWVMTMIGMGIGLADFLLSGIFALLIYIILKVGKNGK